MGNHALMVLLWGLITYAKGGKISYEIKDNIHNSSNYRGLLMYVWDSTTGALEQCSGVFSSGYHNGSNGNQCAVIEDAQNFENAVNDLGGFLCVNAYLGDINTCFKSNHGVPSGKVVGLALRARLEIRPDVNYASFYDRLELFAFGKVTGTSNARNMAGDDAYILITKKGAYSSTKETLTKEEGKEHEKMAEIYHHENAITFIIGSHVNISNHNNSFTYARSEKDKELLLNADFENASVSENWLCPGCTLTSYDNDTFNGNRSVLVTDRRNSYSAPQQRVNVTPGYNYIYKTYFKLLDLPPGVPYITLKLTANIKVNGTSKFLRIGLMPLQQVKFGWTEFSGDFLAPEGATTAQIYINIESTAVNFIQDFASMKRIKPNSFWMQHANSRINNIRKAPLSFRLERTSSLGIEIELLQQKSVYPFGTAIKLDKFNVPEYQFFTDFVLNHFNWAVIANKLKWYGIERIQDQSDYSSVLAALDVLEANGIKSRGHNMFWGVEKFVNSWLYGMSPPELVSEIGSHIDEVINNTKGRLAHWDVNNENLHGDWFEKNTTDADITQKMFQWIHAQEPETRLFLNDYSAIPQSSITTALRNQAVRFRQNNVPIHGIGVQSHFYTTNINMDVTQNIPQYRLDKLAEAGLEIWATELTVDEADDVKKASALEKLLTLYFSHPSVGGVILWHFWNESLWHPNENLFDGPEIKPNAAGQKFLDLVHGAWKSNISQNLDSGLTYNVTGFMGDYILNVKRNGHIIHQQNFTLDSAGKDITVIAETNKSVPQVNIKQWKSYSGMCEEVSPSAAITVLLHAQSGTVFTICLTSFIAVASMFAHNIC